MNASTPHGHGKTTTFIAGLTAGGRIAPMVLDGPMDAPAFVAYVEPVRAKDVRRGDLVILDNLSSHKTARVRAGLLRHRIEHLYLPPYTPDLNPIENAFSKRKRLARGRRTDRRGVVVRARSVDRSVPTNRVRQLPSALRI